MEKNMEPVQDLNVLATTPLISPSDLKNKLGSYQDATETVVRGRDAVKQILTGKDPRLLLVVGPCSIHHTGAALEYAEKLRDLSLKIQDKICVVMRVYFEKPRTTLGWKGLINDPHLDGSCNIEEGLTIARRLLLQINELGVPAATEFLDPITPQYIADMISWAAIGARTTESQTHREMASGLSMPVGFKNGTDGSLQVALDAMSSAQHPHSFLGIDQNGRTSVISAKGNRWGHIVLRGGKGKTNFDRSSIAEAEQCLKKAGLPPGIMVDCSHANSEKKPELQKRVWQSVQEQRRDAGCPIVGVMLESNIETGSQPFPQSLDKIRSGLSITDACLGWAETEELLLGSSLE